MRPAFLLASCAVVLSLATEAVAERNYTAYPPGSKAKGMVASESFATETAAAARLTLSSTPAERIASVRAGNRTANRVQLGILREPPASPKSSARTATWHKVKGGEAAQWKVTIPNARALRIGLDVRSAPPDVRVRIAGASSPEAIAETLPRSGPYWTPIVPGEQATLELFVPNTVARNDVDFVISHVAEFFVNPLTTAETKTYLYQATCEVDLICEAQNDPVLARAGTASVNLVWHEGYSLIMCSGTLLNPADGSFRPYVLTAAHCFDDPELGVQSMTALYFHQAGSCGQAIQPFEDIPGSIQVSGGAELLGIDRSVDGAFIRLNRPPPAGVAFAGWDSSPLAPGEPFTAIHHAQGSVTLVSHGIVGQPIPSYQRIVASFTSGIAEGGSSGSGIFTRTDSGVESDLLARGALSGVNAACPITPEKNLALYGSMSDFWPVLAPYLSTAPSYANVSGLWWNPGESGWGLDLTQQGDTAFGVLFTYDDDAHPVWMSASSLQRGADGTFSGALFRTRGPRFDASAWTPISASQVGELRVRLKDANHASITYTIGGRSVSKDIERQVFADYAPVCVATTANRATAKNYQDLWWNSSEPGWGLAIAHQGDTLFAALFTYDDMGRSGWYVGSSVTSQSDGSYSGRLYQTNGPAFDAQSWRPINATTVGSLRLVFKDGQTATLGYTVGDRSVTKTITRQVFGPAPTSCH